MAGCEIWSVTDQLLATLIDAVMINSWISAGAKKSEKPKPIKRPWDFKAKMNIGERIGGQGKTAQEIHKLLRR